MANSQAMEQRRKHFIRHLGKRALRLALVMAVMCALLWQSEQQSGDASKLPWAQWPLHWQLAAYLACMGIGVGTPLILSFFVGTRSALRCSGCESPVGFWAHFCGQCGKELRSGAKRDHRNSPIPHDWRYHLRQRFSEARGIVAGVLGLFVFGGMFLQPWVTGGAIVAVAYFLGRCPLCGALGAGALSAQKHCHHCGVKL